MPNKDILLIQDLSTSYFTLEGEVKAVNKVGFALQEGEMLGLVGESGCGKTTLGLSIMKLIDPPGRIVSGEILLNGVDLTEKTEKEMRSIRWRDVALIPQSAMNALNPVFKIGQQIAEALRAHERVTRKEAWKRTSQLLEMVGINAERTRDYPHEFSGGMRQRVSIAMALVCNPSMLISDESTTGLDVMTQAQVLGLINDLQRSLNMAIIMISHDLPLVLDICDSLAIIYAGKLVELAEAQAFADSSAHPYSRGLMHSIPQVHGPQTACKSIPGSPPNLIDPPHGCKFHPRCAFAEDVCSATEPLLKTSGGTNLAACHFAGKLERRTDAGL